MAFEFRLPDIGEGVVEGEVIRWHVKTGDKVTEDQPLVEVMTDKATVEIPSPKAGVIKEIRALEGKICAVGAVMVVIDETGSASTATPTASKVETAAPANNGKAHAAPAVTLVTSSPAATSGGKVLATPATRKRARELGVDLNQVRSTGPSGRVLKSDVEAHANGGASAARTAPSYAPLKTAVIAGDERVPFRGVRKKIAENMHRSRQTAAHFTYVEECDMTELVAIRNRARAKLEEQGIKLSFLPFIVKAACMGLKKFPIINSTLDEGTQEIVLRKQYHVGVAAATPEGLIVPVVRDADHLSLVQIARSLQDLSDRARVGKASREEITGSTFTISSLGAIGGVLATPIINFPEVAIMGVHKIKSTPVVRDGQIVVREIMNLSISLDHRVVDGYEGAQFLTYVISLLEDPTSLFLEMV